jgi:hypothetical protein
MLIGRLSPDILSENAFLDILAMIISRQLWSRWCCRGAMESLRQANLNLSSKLTASSLATRRWSMASHYIASCCTSQASRSLTSLNWPAPSTAGAAQINQENCQQPRNNYYRTGGSAL